jgi:sec-independent protein translocase protein TatC
MKNKQTNQISRKTSNKKTSVEDFSRPFVEHVYEIRKRLIYIVSSIGIFSLLAYFVQQKIVHLLLLPAKNQQFIYTSPGGGISFLFQICTYVGIICSLPIILYQLLKFLEPIIQKHATSTLVFKASIVSLILAVMGFVFGYTVGLPVALHYLSNQFHTSQIHALFTIQEYMSFLTVYLGGSALLFQLPLLVWLIDKIKPRGPKPFIRFERYLIAGSFIIAGLMAPVPNIIYQAMIAVPIIIMYQFAVILVWLKTKAKRSKVYNYQLETYELPEHQSTPVLRPPTPAEYTSTTDIQNKQPTIAVKRGVYIDGIVLKNSNRHVVNTIQRPKTNNQLEPIRTNKLIQEIFTPDSSQISYV